uniref:Uncharacterized protein n=1 Tax=Macrostomum lignano TaxID=282301 RepID=A0A1I8JRI2_9PLAT
MSLKDEACCRQGTPVDHPASRSPPLAPSRSCSRPVLTRSCQFTKPVPAVGLASSRPTTSLASRLNRRDCSATSWPRPSTALW